MLLIAAVLGCLAAAASLAAGGSARRALAVVVAVAALAVPFVLPSSGPLARLVAAVGASWGLVRIADLVAERPSRHVLLRIWHSLAGFDTREVTWLPPSTPWRSRLDLPGFAGALLSATVAAGAFLVAARASERPLRWLAGATFVYAVAETVDRGARATYHAAGVVVAPIQRFPLAARSLTDFWGRRWNRIVSAWLARHLFRPLARRGHAALGLAAAFAASALLHAFHMLAAVGLSLAAVMALFFIAQGALIGVERLLGVARWPPAAARAWFLAALLATSPLFVEPTLRVMGIAQLAGSK